MKKIEIDGKEYNFDIEKAREIGVLIPIQKIRVGQHYSYTDLFRDSTTYVLSSAFYDDNANVVLISLKTGQRWTNPTRVNDELDISQEEWDAITVKNKFERVNVNFKITPFKE